MEILNMKTFAKTLNNLTFTDYYYRLMLLARCMYKWDGLPDNIDEKWIERFLYLHGSCVFFDDDVKGLMVAQCTQNGNLNMYDEPTSVTPYGIDYTSPKPVQLMGKKKNGVLIRNNDDMIATSFTLKLFAYRLADISRTIDINIHAQKTPVLLQGSEKQKMTLKHVYNQWDGNEPVIFGDKALDSIDFKVHKTDAPIVFPQLQTQKQCIWNEALTFLGINNANTEKRERLITNEVDANNEHIDISASCFLRAREKACEEINKLFGLNLSVRKRTLEEVNECFQNTRND